MNCQDFDAILLDLVRGEAASSAREEGRAHGAACARCAALLSEQRRLSLGLKALASRADEDQAPQQVELALRAEFCRYHAQALGLGAPERQDVILELASRIFKNRWAWALAAIVIVAAAGGMAAKLLMKPRATPLTQTPPQWAAQPRAPHPAVGAAVLPQRLGEHPTTQEAVRRRDSHAPALVPPRSTARAQNFSSGRATSFYLLPYSSGLDLDEGWEIVRLNMPVSALASLGVPVVDEGPLTQYVTADVVLGGDGMARAIRFVH
jgi:hypothetical protein